jgi:hypothetical protein
MGFSGHSNKSILFVQNVMAMYCISTLNLLHKIGAYLK